MQTKRAVVIDLFSYRSVQSSDLVNQQIQRMDPFKNSDGRGPFIELPANIVGDDSCVVADPRQCKRERDRARYAAMSDEQRSQMNTKHCESYQRRKGQHLQP
ncbi:hypothetical protein BS78_05G116500 [Paspalum vaginatum]|nr:hypothetical protein BS78_05G116500 [Paspalum vaginatum]